MYEIARAENKDYRLTIFQDEDCGRDDPRDWTNVGTFLTWTRDYHSPDKNPYPTPGDFLQEWIGDEEEEIEPIGLGGVLLDVYMIDHSGVAYSAVPHGSRKPYLGTDWDTGQVGYIYVGADKIAEEWGNTLDPIAKATAYLTGEVETYSKWANGEVYGFVVERKVRERVQRTDYATGMSTFSDEERWEELEDGSCWGFYCTNGPHPWAGIDVPGEVADLVSEL